ncbi:MAG: hypothetical protein HOM55_06495 [Proteobacteria bacterium]|nr:hypothetical protein [Pseudomonadota bacterium]
MADSTDSQLESRVSEFDGRIHAYSSIERGNPIGPLLADDAVRIADKYPLAKTIPSRQLVAPVSIAMIAFMAGLWLLFAGPNLFNFSLQHLFAGWAVDGLLPPQVITVSPGDEMLRRGGRLNIDANISGFAPEQVVLHVKNEGGEWQEVVMAPTMSARLASEVGDEIFSSPSESSSSNSSRNYDFTFFSVRDPMSYYVSARGVRSPEYQIDVVDLPGIRNLKITYNYPEWTGLEPELKEQGGDIEAVPDTRIDIEVVLDAPIPGGEIILNGESQALRIAESSAFTDFEIEADGKYYIAALLGDEQVRLSDDYFIRVAGDEKPEIEFVRPGRDWRASNIEEVTVEIAAKDDFSLVNMELRYSVNGSDWQSVSLPAGENQLNAKHQFFLENMGKPVNLNEAYVQEAGRMGGSLLAEGSLPAEGFNPAEGSLSTSTTVPDYESGFVPGLVAGDLISYYAVVEDRSQKVQTDIFFIEVQPFDRRFSQSQQSGGMGGGQQGANEQEISQRQREIIVSTWNLLREQADSATGLSVEGRITDNSLLLSGLQTSLAEEAQSLIDTAISRQLTSDPRIKTYTEHLQRAIDAMTPASERLLEIALEQAIQPEQTALQHLLRADAVFNDIQVSMGGGGGGGMGGGQAGADLAEMFELEMDLEQNRYETGERATPEAVTEETESAMDELAELARRQQRLAENLANSSTPIEEQRWQQELLRRETEELRARLEEMAQQGQTGQPGQPGQAGGSQQGGQPSEAGQPGTQSELAGADDAQLTNRQQDELNRRLESALDAMDRVSEAMQGGGTGSGVEDLAQTAAEAQRQLEGAGERMEQSQSEAIAQAFNDMAENAGELYTDQRALEQELMEGISQAIAEMAPGSDRISDPFSYEEHLEFGAEKRDMLTQLQALKDNMQKTASQVKRESPKVARALEAADQMLRDSELSGKIDRAVSYMNQGATLYIANSESLVTSGFRDLRERLELARQMFTQTDGELNEFDQTLAEIRESRNELRDLIEGAQPSVGNAGNSPAGEQPSDQSLSENQENSTGEGEGLADTEEQGGQAGQTGQADQTGQSGQVGRGAWARANGFDLESAEAASRELGALAGGIGGVIGGLRDRGVSEGQVRGIQDLIRQLQNDALLGGQPSIVELSRTLALLEQIEQEIEKGLDSKQVITRNERVDEVPVEYKDAVADYYRRLSVGSNSAGADVR